MSNVVNCRPSAALPPHGGHAATLRKALDRKPKDPLTNPPKWQNPQSHQHPKNLAWQKTLFRAFSIIYMLFSWLSKLLTFHRTVCQRCHAPPSRDPQRPGVPLATLPFLSAPTCRVPCSKMLRVTVSLRQPCADEESTQMVAGLRAEVPGGGGRPRVRRGQATQCHC